MRGSVRLKSRESNRKNELEQFKITGESRRGAERVAIGAKPGEPAVSHNDFEFQVYLARNSSDQAI
jgi:hypothetical protein